jgi:hypothetical protein
MIERNKYLYEFAESRDGVRSLCRQFDSRYWQEVDEIRSFHETVVKALAKAYFH